MQFLKPLELKIRRFRNRVINPIRYRGDAVYCPVCERSFSQFLPAGTRDGWREQAVCPFCKARERDRLNWLFFASHKELFACEDMRLLHIAPEPELRRFFKRQVGAGYLCADIVRDDVALKLDVSALGLASNCLDAIYCSHVFQDVPDDTGAMSECLRVLKPGGWAILNVPIHGETTQQAAAPEKISKAWDKRPDEFLRRYGLDYTEKLRAVGFEVNCIAPADLVGDIAQRERLGIATREAGFVHFVKKPG
ncbi:MAG: SAM-dependent methyltransferase [Gammaproteobacteria bacterium]|nr:MAG: SAM-dependent methyltransferase [Gammaproteobacteria bacterium]